MRAFFVLLLLAAGPAMAGVVTCANGTAGGPLSSCTTTWACLDTLPSQDTLARTVSATGVHTWQKWSAIADTDNIRTCNPDGWTAKRLATVTVTSPTSEPVPPPVADPVVAQGQDVTLTWTAPTLNTDGSALTNLAGFRIYRGASVTTLTQVASLPATSTSYVFKNLPAGAYLFAVKSFTPDAESSLSNTVGVTVKEPVCPAAPATETRSQACPAPLIGSFTQTNAWKSAAAPTCWTAEWLPVEPPAGICASPPSLTTGDTRAFEVRPTTFVAVGFVAVGALCGPETLIRNSVKYCKVTRSQIDMVVWPANLAGDQFWVRASP